MQKKLENKLRCRFKVIILLEHKELNNLQIINLKLIKLKTKKKDLCFLLNPLKILE